MEVRLVAEWSASSDGSRDTRTTGPQRPPHLTPRQVEVLRLLEQGRSTKRIAGELHLSTETVRNHIRRLSPALGVHSRLRRRRPGRIVRAGVAARSVSA
ncbi:MAG: response regulator transcription factor [Gaiellaceae bacterium]